ncbi:MAG: VOC family protein [Planctomycetota bacterium]
MEIGDDEPRPTALSAVTLVTSDMARSFAFYEALGFKPCAGGATAPFSSFRIGGGFLNLMAQGAELEGALEGTSSGAPHRPGAPMHGWGRVIVHVSDVDAFHARVTALGLAPHAPPRDAEWGERYFHLTDPDGHALSFARPLEPRTD